MEYQTFQERDKSLVAKEISKDNFEASVSCGNICTCACFCNCFGDYLPRSFESSADEGKLEKVAS